MKLKSRLIAVAVCTGIPVTLVAQSPNDIYQGEYLLKISVPGIPWPITASSTYEADGTLKEVDYVPAPISLESRGNPETAIGPERLADSL